MKTTFLKPKGDYRSLIVYRKAECIYDLTYHFAHRFLDRGDRTIDQMVQAARSGKQNIIEGSSASTTSRETEIKLFNVARASFDELLADYDDYMRVRGIRPWENEKQNSVREFCRTHNDSALYRQIAPRTRRRHPRQPVPDTHLSGTIPVAETDRACQGRLSRPWRHPRRDVAGPQGIPGSPRLWERWE